MKEINPLEIPVPENVRKLYSFALTLAIITVVYNLAEGLVSIFFGLKGETLTLFGFGADSFIETISALGVTQMIIRIKMNPSSDKGPFEILALKITGWCFYLLAGILAISAVFDVIEGHQPTSTIAGIIIALISILCMWALIYYKLSVGKKTKFRSNYCGCKMFTGLSVYVSGIACSKRFVVVFQNTLHRHCRNSRIDLFFC